jgi:PII-like signaling protein
MHHTFRGERTLMRIFIGESDKCSEGEHKGKALYEALLLTLRANEFAGATVVRAIAGFGATAKPLSDKILRLSMDLPIIIEVVEAEERIQTILPTLDRMIGGGLITLEKVRVILYRPANLPEDDRWRHRIAGLAPGNGNS